MSTPLEQLDYNKTEGTRDDRDLVVFSLSTCAFCRKAMEFLKEHGFSYRYAYLDLVEVELKREVKKELKTTYGKLAVFPVLVVDGEKAISGFEPERWLQAIEGSGE
jgi:glutaredoxin-like protein NrdH